VRRGIQPSPNAPVLNPLPRTTCGLWALAAGGSDRTRYNDSSRRNVCIYYLLDREASGPKERPPF